MPSRSFKIILLVVFGILIIHTAEARRFKIATLSPEGSFWMERMREGAEEIAHKTNDRIRFKFYPGGVMGNDETVLRKIRIGQLHGGAFMAGSLSNIFPGNQVYALPMKFRSFKEVSYVRERMDSLIINGFEKNGFVTFGLAEAGFAYIMSKTPVQNLASLKQRKVWIPTDDDMSLETLKVFDIDPIPLSLADVRVGLQTGLIDTVATSPIGALVLQWHTEIKYITDKPLIYLYGMMVMSRKAFSKIAPEDQSLVRNVMEKTFHEIDKNNRRENLNAIQALKNQGIVFCEPEASSEWHQMAAAVHERLVSLGILSKELVETLDKHLEKVRNLRTFADSH